MSAGSGRGWRRLLVGVAVAGCAVALGVYLTGPFFATPAADKAAPHGSVENPVPRFFLSELEDDLTGVTVVIESIASGQPSAIGITDPAVLSAQSQTAFVADSGKASFGDLALAVLARPIPYAPAVSAYRDGRLLRSWDCIVADCANGTQMVQSLAALVQAGRPVVDERQWFDDHDAYLAALHRIKSSPDAITYPETPLERAPYPNLLSLSLPAFYVDAAVDPAFAQDGNAALMKWLAGELSRLDLQAELRGASLTRVDQPLLVDRCVDGAVVAPTPGISMWSSLYAQDGNTLLALSGITAWEGLASIYIASEDIPELQQIDTADLPGPPSGRLTPDAVLARIEGTLRDADARLGLDCVRPLLVENADDLSGGVRLLDAPSPITYQLQWTQFTGQPRHEPALRQ
ncbi:hypothetical protein [Paracoccus tegillarcae]|uniref:Uncharacterized protein n=1 Tax=Paracoccus tegillarcae TaxID=1529068 RepID=A0A2K9EXS6_9RHOB|nr:hypothetical protein [Paracoccus tegillarcae]AUH34114.1 hypothetical protein CUV01_12545 [Paracoccus tegillarcae]